MSEPPFGDQSAESIAERIARAPKGRDIFPAMRQAMGLPPFDPESLKEPLPLWTEEEAAEFTAIIEEMFEREP